MKKVCNVSIKPKYKGEPLEAMLRRFKKKVEKSGVIADIRKKEYYVAPAEAKRIKHKKAVQRLRKEQSKRAARLGLDK